MPSGVSVRHGRVERGAWDCRFLRLDHDRVGDPVVQALPRVVKMQTASVRAISQPSRDHGEQRDQHVARPENRLIDAREPSLRTTLMSRNFLAIDWRSSRGSGL